MPLTEGIAMTSHSKSFTSAACLLFLAAAVAPLSASPAFAWGTTDRMHVAMSLGDLLASGKACGFEYDREAIFRFIDSKVPADDMKFPSTLDMYTDLAAHNLEKMSQAQLATHCYQIMRSAKANGILSDSSTASDPSSF